MKIISVMLLTCTVSFAKDPQPPVSPQNLDSLDPVLVQHLRAWEASLRGIRNFAADATLTKVNLVTKREDQFSVSLWMMKPQMSRLNMKRITNAAQSSRPDSFEAIIRNGTAAYHYDGDLRLLTKFRKIGDSPVPSPTEKGIDSLILQFERQIAKSLFDNFIDFFENLTAQSVVDRYTVHILKQDQNYLFLELKPRNPIEKMDIESMTLVLCLPGVRDLAYVPRLIQLKKANGQEVEMCDIPNPRVNSPQIKASHFEYVAPPKDWQIQEVVLPTKVPDPAPVAVVPVCTPMPVCTVMCTPVPVRKCHRGIRRCRR